jgi:hypothetical protein
MRRASVLAVVAVLLLPIAAARAQPPGLVPPREPVDGEFVPHRYPLVALGLSLGLSAAGGAMVAGGEDYAALGVLTMYFGPSIGRWYGGGSAAIGLLGRTAGALFVVAAIEEDYPIDDDCFPDEEDCTAHDQAVADQDRRVKRLLYTAAALWVGSTIYDCVRAPLDARDFNREHAVKVAPTVMPAGNGALVPALALSGRF